MFVGKSFGCVLVRLASVVLISALVIGVGASMSVPVKAQAAKTPTVIACFHKKSGRVAGLAHPNQCVIRGYRGRGRQRIVAFTIRGIRWGHWGAVPTRGAFGNDVRTGEGVRIIAYRRVECDDGRAWYSRVILNFRGTGNFFELRLPTCVGSS
jgi:hypothetical protein